MARIVITGGRPTGLEAAQVATASTTPVTAAEARPAVCDRAGC